MLAYKSGSGPVPRSESDDIGEETGLLARVAAGESEAFRGLVDRHLPTVLAIARRMLRDDAEAEDVAQETMLRLWRNAAGLELGPHGVRPWLAHALLGPGSVEFETDRCRFLGRGRDSGRPRALVAPGPLSGAQGSVLDPVLCLRRRVTLAPRAHQEFVFALAAAPDREDAVARLARLHDPAAIRASRAAAEANARERARRHGLTAGEAMELERIGAALAYGDPRLAALRFLPGFPSC